MLAIAYVTGLSLLWNSSARTILSTCFRPLGRMALTNYIGASFLVFVLTFFIDFQAVTGALWPPVIAIFILVAQWIVSTLWLRVFRYGPLEWLWRMGTRWQRVYLPGHARRQ